MKKTLSTIAIAVFALLGTQAVLAQDKTRTEVKQEAATANKAGDTAVGQQPAVKEETPRQAAKHTDTTRAKRKAKASKANKAGDTATGMAPSEEASKEQTNTMSDTTRAKRKAKTSAANKAGDIKSGEANIPAKDK